jgi:hypothetical protein
MFESRKNGITSLFSLLLMIYSMNQASAAQNCEDLFGPIIYKAFQDPSIFRAHQYKLKNNLFTINRNLEGRDSYQKDFDSPQIKPLKRYIENILSQGGIWMDMGAGTANAQRSFLNQKMEANTQLIATGFIKPFITGSEDIQRRQDIINMATELSTYQNNFRYIETGFLEESLENPQPAIKQMYGQIDLLTDELGPLIYTYDIQAIINVYARLLKKGGTALISFWEPNTTILVNNQRVLFRDLAPLFPLLSGGQLRVRASGMVFSNHQPLFEKSFFEIVKVQEEENDFFPILQTQIQEEGTPPFRRVQLLNPKNLSTQFGLRIRIDRVAEFSDEGRPTNPIVNKFVKKSDNILNN